MGNVYIVHDTSGEYSDREEWTVCAYRNYEDAVKHAELAERKAKEIYVGLRYNLWQQPPGLNVYDPNCKSYRYDACYFVSSCPLLTQLPNGEEQ